MVDKDIRNVCSVSDPDIKDKIDFIYDNKPLSVHPEWNHNLHQKHVVSLSMSPLITETIRTLYA